MVRPNKNDINSMVKKIKDEEVESNTESNAKRKYKDENEDIDEITLLDGLPKNESVPAKKRKKIITADKILKLEQEQV